MENNDWWLIGEVRIPEDKKEEFNKFVLELLDRCGIRKTEEIILDGKKVTVIKKAVSDEKGIVYFDYSIFEKKCRKVCTYDMNTCKLYTPDRDGNEFGIVMNLIIALQEAYTDGECYMMYKDKPIEYMIVYLKLLHFILGRKFYLNNRGRVWDMFLFFRNDKNSGQVSKSDIISGIPWKYTHLDNSQFAGIIDLNNTEIRACKEKNKIYAKDAIANACYAARIEYLYEIIKKFQREDNKALDDFLTELLDSNLEKRKLIAKREDDYGIIAELSLYMLPSNIINTYTIVKEREFWETWDSFNIKGYTDTLLEKDGDIEEGSTPDKLFSFYKAIRRDTEDEFLEFWNGTNLAISKQLEERIEDWKLRLKQMDDISTEAVEKYLAEIILDLRDDWICRFVDKEFVEEILNHREDVLYRKALVLFRDLMDEDIRYFPELTRKQAIDWVIKSNRDDYENIVVMAYQSLFINKAQRKLVLGF